ncbi:MAG TPA: hypothetical protein DCQ98_05785 [Planctomycetaceae bacterium]|nr:hypothetical protein [Planctomycetaceae bacterium]
MSRASEFVELPSARPIARLVRRFVREATLRSTPEALGGRSDFRVRSRSVVPVARSSAPAVRSLAAASRSLRDRSGRGVHVKVRRFVVHGAPAARQGSLLTR